MTQKSIFVSLGSRIPRFSKSLRQMANHLYRHWIRRYGCLKLEPIWINLNRHDSMRRWRRRRRVEGFALSRISISMLLGAVSLSRSYPLIRLDEILSYNCIPLRIRRRGHRTHYSFPTLFPLYAHRCHGSCTQASTVRRNLSASWWLESRLSISGLWGTPRCVWLASSWEWSFHPPLFFYREKFNSNDGIASRCISFLYFVLPPRSTSTVSY